MADFLYNEVYIDHILFYISTMLVYPLMTRRDFAHINMINYVTSNLSTVTALNFRHTDFPVLWVSTMSTQTILYVCYNLPANLIDILFCVI